MSTITQTWTDNVSVVGAQVLARGATARGTLDLRAKVGAFLHARIGRGGTTGLTNGVSVLIRRVLNNDGAGGVHPAGMPELLSSAAAAISTTVDSDSNSGQAVLNVTSEASFAAGDILCIQDADAGVTRLEWARVSSTGSGVLNLDRNLTYTHTAVQADTVRNKADAFTPIWMPGGSLYEVIFDYGDDAAGESVTVQAIAQTYDSDSVA